MQLWIDTALEFGDLIPAPKGWSSISDIELSFAGSDYQMV